jgi:hypothetical protein
MFRLSALGEDGLRASGLSRHAASTPPAGTRGHGISPPRGTQVRSTSSAQVKVGYLNKQELEHTSTSYTWSHTKSNPG